MWLEIRNDSAHWLWNVHLVVKLYTDFLPWSVKSWERTNWLLFAAGEISEIVYKMLEV